MADVSLPKVLVLKSWTSGPGGDEKSIAAALKSLASAYDKFDADLVEIAKLDDADDMENRIEALDEAINGPAKVIATEAKAAANAAKAVEAKLKKESKPDKALLAAVLAVGKAANDFAVDLPEAVKAAKAELGKRLVKQKADEAKQADKDKDPELDKAGLDWINDKVLKNMRLVLSKEPQTVAADDLKGQARLMRFYFAQGATKSLLWVGLKADGGHKKKLMALLPGMKLQFFKGFVLVEEKGIITFVCQPPPSVKKLKAQLIAQAKRRNAVRIRKKFGGPVSEEEGGDDAEDGEGTGLVAAKTAGGDAQKEFNEQREAKSKAYVQAFGLAKAMPTTAMAGAAAMLKKKIEDATNLAKTSAGVERAKAILKEADAIAEKMIQTGGGAAKAGAPTVAADVAARIRKAGVAWTTMSANAEKGIDDVVAALKKMFEGDARQKAAVDTAIKRLQDIKKKLGDATLTQQLNDAAKQPNQAARERVIGGVIKTALAVQARIASDKLIDELDGANNDVLPGLNIITPLKAALGEIRALA